MKRLIETRVFAVLACFPLLSAAAIYFILPEVLPILFSPTGTEGDWVLEIFVAIGASYLLLYLSIIPSVVIAIMGIVHTASLMRKGENAAMFMILTLIAAIPALFMVQQYIFETSRFIP